VLGPEFKAPLSQRRREEKGGGRRKKVSHEQENE
jgi:hypothetical protein